MVILCPLKYIEHAKGLMHNRKTTNNSTVHRNVRKTLIEISTNKRATLPAKIQPYKIILNLWNIHFVTCLI